VFDYKSSISSDWNITLSDLNKEIFIITLTT